MSPTVFRRRLFRVDVVALILVLLVIGVGWFVINNERDDRISDNRDLTCALATWNGRIVSYFEGARERLMVRIGTPDETATDRGALAQVGVLLDASVQLDRDLGDECGSVIPTLNPPGEVR